MGLPDASTTDRYVTVAQGIFDLLGDHLPEKCAHIFGAIIPNETNHDGDRLL
jgi:hypothetical protein